MKITARKTQDLSERIPWTLWAPGCYSFLSTNSQPRSWSVCPAQNNSGPLHPSHTASPEAHGPLLMTDLLWFQHGMVYSEVTQLPLSQPFLPLVTELVCLKTTMEALSLPTTCRGSASCGFLQGHTEFRKLESPHLEL